MTKMKKITSKNPPTNWKNEYSNYYYKFNTGTEVVLKQYSSTSKDKYVLMKSKPSDWNDNYGSYYKKVYTKEVEEKKNGRTQKVTKEYETKVDGSKLEWKAVPAKEEEVLDQNGKVKKDEDGNKVTKEVTPDFISNKYYRRDSREITPKYKSSNCYLPYQKVTLPAWVNNQYYDKKETVKIPIFEPKKYYKQVLDHYAGMLNDGLEYLSGQSTGLTQRVTIEDYDLNIGDTVGGKDDLTGLTIVQTVTNIIVKLESGVLNFEYEIGTDQEIGG